MTVWGFWARILARTFLKMGPLMVFLLYLLAASVLANVLLLRKFTRLSEWYEYYLNPRELVYAQVKLEKVLSEVVELARKKGFKFETPSVSAHNSRKYGLLGASYSMPARAMANKGESIAYDLDYFSIDNDLGYVRAVMAHELGHIIDKQTERKGHPLFDKIKHLDGEGFADAFAVYICSKEEIIEGLKKPSYRERYKGLSAADIEALDLNAEAVLV